MASRPASAPNNPVSAESRRGCPTESATTFSIVCTWVMGSAGGHSGPAFMTAVEIKTGRIAWQTRDFAKAQLLYADGKLIVLDEDGVLALARATPERFQVLSRVSLQKRLSWTPPTLVGARLYVRDRATISALDLGAGAPKKK